MMHRAPYVDRQLWMATATFYSRGELGGDKQQPTLKCRPWRHLDHPLLTPSLTSPPITPIPRPPSYSRHDLPHQFPRRDKNSENDMSDTLSMLLTFLMVYCTWVVYATYR